MKVMNVAVVGAGIYGINHVNAYTWNPNTNLVAVCDLNKEITDRIAEQYNVKTYNDVNEMLDNEEIDAVSIATPDAFHMDPALAAIRHGKPILVEKPLATTSEDAKKILAEAEKYNVRVAVDYHKRWDPAAINVRNELQNEESGAPIRGYMCMDDIIDDQIKILKERGFVHEGNVVVNTGSIPIQLHLPTNMLKITKVQ